MSWLRLVSLFVAAACAGCGSSSAHVRTKGGQVPGGGASRAGQGPARFVTLGEIQSHVRSSSHKVVLVHLWATWCPPCMDELPAMAALARSLPSRGVELLSVSMDTASAKAAARVGRVIDRKAEGALTRAIARYEDLDAFIEGLDPQWEGSIPAILAYLPSGQLVGAIYGEASRDEIEGFVADLPLGNARGVAPTVEAKR